MFEGSRSKLTKLTRWNPRGASCDNLPLIALQGVRKVGDCGETLSVDAGESESWSPDVETKEYHFDGYPVIVGKGGAWGTVRSSAGGGEDLLYKADDVFVAVVMRKCSGPQVDRQ